jgi:FeS assembly protein IscX
LGLTFRDAPALGRLLAERFPGRDPLGVRMPDLERWVVELPGFADPPEAATPRLLEAIQMQWYQVFSS